MGKNRKFRNSYMIEIEGTTSNGFQAQLFDELIRGVCRAFSVNAQQSSVHVKTLSTEGDYDTEIRKVKEGAK